MINLITVNVNGLKHRPEHLYRIIYENNIDIICLQEVHDFSSEQVHNLEKKLQGTFYLDSNKGWTGTGIIIRGKLQNLKIKHLQIQNSSLKKQTNTSSNIC